MYSQIIQILTSGVNRIFQNRAHFDLRNLLGGTDKFLDSLAHQMGRDPSFLLDSVHCVRMKESLRTNIGNIMQAARANDLIFSILIARHQLINLVIPRRNILSPSDLHLITNFINGSTSFRSTETWTPICLPAFNDKGFLHAHICYVIEDVCLLLLSTKPDSFFELAECRNQIAQGLQSTGAAEALQDILKHQYYSVSEVGISGLLHFLYKSRGTSQYTAPVMEAPYTTSSEQKRLFRLYQHVHTRVNASARPHYVYYLVGQSEAILGWITQGFELYATFGPLETKSMAIRACNQLLRWIKQEENSLFIMNSPVF